MIFNGQTFMPNYEGRVMAFIIVVMKILFGMDGITEYEISRVAEKINMFVSIFFTYKLQQKPFLNLFIEKNLKQLQLAIFFMRLLFY